MKITPFVSKLRIVFIIIWIYVEQKQFRSVFQKWAKSVPGGVFRKSGLKTKTK